MNTTSSLSGEMQTYYEKVFLKRAEYEFVLMEGAQLRSQSQNNGKTLWFNRYTPLALQTTPLSEGVNPPVSSISSSQVSVVLAEYGLTVKISKFLSLTSIDVNNREKIAILGQNMGETINHLVALELENASNIQIAGGATASTVAASNTFAAAEIRAAVATLESNKAMAYPDGFFLGKTNPHDKVKLIADSVWINAKTYSDVKDLYNGEMGELYQTRFLNNKGGNTSGTGGGYGITDTGSGAASGVTLYHTYIHGSDAFGCYNLDGDKPRLIIVPNQVDSGNPAGRFSLASWAGVFAAKILNANWIVLVKSA